MSTRTTRITSALCCLGVLPLYAGCSRGNHSCDTAEKCMTTERVTTESRPQITQTTNLAEWPPNAVAGECYAKVYVPAKFETVSEKVCTREACEKLEIVPARYDWVEERVMVKDASTQLVEVPAEFKSSEKTVCVHPGQAGWVMDTSSGRCKTDGGLPAKDVFCLVATPPVTKTITTQTMTKACCTREVAVPAEYETRRVQKCVAAATTKRTAIAAEYENVDRTVAVGTGHMEWQRVVCDVETKPITINAVKGALMAAGYKTGPMNGELEADDLAAIKDFQVKNGLGVGGLSYETMNKLQVSAR